MALSTQTKHNLILSLVGVLVVFGGFTFLMWGGQWRQQISWDNPQYHRDPRAPKVCMCLWERSAFRVPCEDIPPELLKE